MSRGRRHHQQNLPFTAAFALIRALREPGSGQQGHASFDEAVCPPPHDSFCPNFMNALSEGALPENDGKERPGRTF